jgi:transglutaminase-like putative cysteine protease
MKLKQFNPDLESYCQASSVINCNHPEIVALAQQFAEKQYSDIAIAKVSFEWVRDNIKHSLDYKLNPITCIASDVLQYKTGYCYAKSHLLAALLRANNIPAGLCYQRLSKEDNGAPYCLHGLNAVYLQDFGWYRIDPRGNKENVDAQFVPPREKLAFKTMDKLEKDFPAIWPVPLPVVIETLQNNHTFHEVYLNLPDYVDQT